MRGMDLRPRSRKVHSGFTSAEVEKMEKVLKDLGEKSMDPLFHKKLTKSFNCSSGRAGKPVLKWTEVQSWFQDRQLDLSSKDDSVDGSTNLNPEVGQVNKPNGSTPTSNAGKKESSEKVFEAKSSKDGAWYDMLQILTLRTLSSGEAEALVRFDGFKSSEDEWVNLKESVRERSLGLEAQECHLLKAGDLVLCFLETNEFSKHYDAHVVKIEKKRHDARGCRCQFLIRYNHNNVEETLVGLSRLSRRPPGTNVRMEEHEVNY